MSKKSGSMGQNEVVLTRYPREKKRRVAHKFEPLAEPPATRDLLKYAPRLSRLPTQVFGSRVTPLDVLLGSALVKFSVFLTVESTQVTI